MVPLTSVYSKYLHLVSLDAEFSIFPLLYFEICKYFVLIYDICKIRKNNIHLQEDLKQIRMHRLWLYEMVFAVIKGIQMSSCIFWNDLEWRHFSLWHKLVFMMGNKESYVLYWHRGVRDPWEGDSSLGICGLFIRGLDGRAVQPSEPM